MTKQLALLSVALLAANLAHADASTSSWSILPRAPYGISGDGKTVVGEDYGVDQVYTWSAGTGVTYIGGRTEINPGPGPAAINFDGSRIAASGVNPVSGKLEAGYYTPATGQWTYLGGLGSSNSSGTTSSAWGMSANGQFIVGFGYSGGAGTDNVRGVIWNTATGTAINLGSSGLQAPLTRAQGVSNDGRVVGGRGGNGTPLVWTDFDGDGSYTRINVNTATGAGLNVVNGITSDGAWAFGGGTASYMSGAAYRFNPATSTLQMLPKLGSGDYDTVTAANADGSVLVGFETTSTGMRTGFIWTANTGIQTLDSYFAGYGIDVNDTFSFATPMGISADGLSFTGYGYMLASPGADVGFQVSIAQAVPEPASYAMLIAGLGAVGFVARRRGRAVTV